MYNTNNENVRHSDMGCNSERLSVVSITYFKGTKPQRRRHMPPLIDAVISNFA